MTSRRIQTVAAIVLALLLVLPAAAQSVPAGIQLQGSAHAKLASSQNRPRALLARPLGHEVGGPGRPGPRRRRRCR